MTESFGFQVFNAEPCARFALQEADGDRTAFADYDRALSALFERLFRGDDLFVRHRTDSRTEPDTITLSISAADRDALNGVLSPEAQQARGGWYMPADSGEAIGFIGFSHWAHTEERFTISVAEANGAYLTLDTPDTVVTWAALAPVMELVWLPLKLRSGHWLGSRRPELMAKDWATVDSTYAALGLDPGPLARFKDGRSWATLSIPQVLSARQALVQAWRNAPSDVGKRALAFLITRLIDRYYLKAKNGMAQRTKVMNKGLERALTGGFGGDWLALVRYLGETVHPAEQIATALPPTSLIVSGRTRTEQAAASTGVPAAEIDRIMSAFWGGQDQSPIDARVDAIKAWWDAFTDLHARQEPGMPALWGLRAVRYEEHGDNFDEGPYSPGMYRRLPAQVNEPIESLWCTCVLHKWPGALVTEPYPHAAFGEALGPAIDFWEGIALTCWFICEGPYSRTDIAGAPEYYARELKALSDLGCPINHQLFTDLRVAEGKLTERPMDAKQTHFRELRLSLGISIGPNAMDGFQHLRDVVTSHRTEWADRHLDGYVRDLWERDLRGVGDTYHRRMADKGKAPTAKQFAAFAAGAANRWFGGDLTQLAGALGLPAEDPPSYKRLLPADRAAFVGRVRSLLGAEPYPERSWELELSEDDLERLQRNNRRYEIGARAPDTVQIWEATGEPPTLKTASGWVKARLQSSFGDDPDAGWQTYIDAVTEALATTGEAIPSARPGP